MALRTKKPALSSRSTPAVIVKHEYIEAIGRRKTSVARVRVYKEPKGSARSIEINEKSFVNYFPQKKHQHIVNSPLEAAAVKHFQATVHVSGSGINAQAEAVRLGIARALVAMDGENRKALKAFGYLTRDARKVERKKPGLRKARRPQQWRKR